MRRTAICLLSLVTLVACKQDATTDDPVTAAEAQQALDEANVSAQASALASGSIELGTSFTIGGAVEDAAAQVRDFVASQLPCADVQLGGATVTVTYGAKPGACTFHGQTFHGSSSITVKANGQGQVEVDHVFTALTNGRVTLDGTATVTWDAAATSRRVQHQLTWTRVADGFSATGDGDRTQRPLAAGIAVGFAEDGSRSWLSRRGAWDLGIAGAQMRWVDPVPQAGTYTLHTPAGKTLTTTFARKDADTITVTMTSGARSFTFDVTALGITAR